jgi:hypothetical protein
LTAVLNHFLDVKGDNGFIQMNPSHGSEGGEGFANRGSENGVNGGVNRGERWAAREG